MTQIVPFTESLGPEYSETHILDLELTWEESEPRTPLVCILSTGSDPTNQIIALAKLKNIRKFHFTRKQTFKPFSCKTFHFETFSNSNQSRIDGTRSRVSCS